MCRIAGIINSSFALPQLKDFVSQMCDTMKHGGPDDEGFYANEDVRLVLGNRRLSLVDLSNAGHQPMHYQNRYTITFNGEIYNFRSIRTELENLGHHFVSHTDTEVVLAAFAQWNTQSFERLNGMFAFALWDNQEKILYLTRDAVGIKPLYYSYSSGGLVFGSEMRSFSSIPFLQKDNDNWPVYLLAYGHIPEPVTTLSSVVPLKKGCFLSYNTASGEMSLQSFKHFSYTESLGKRGTESQELKSIMQDAVSRQLMADASIGVFLSGGLDSAILTSVSAQSKKSNVNTLSLYFAEELYSEKKYQDLLLQQIQSRSFQHLLKEEEFLESFPTILADMDMPCSDGINVWFISKYAKAEGLKAVLSGIGADELFGGYPSFSRMKIAKLFQHIPELLITFKKKSALKQFNRLSYLKMDGIKGLYLFLRGHFSPYEIAKQLDASEAQIWDILNELPVMNDVTSLSNKNQASWMEFNLYMQNQLLRDADVMGMIHSVEIRVPFLDEEVVQYALAMNPDLKFGGAKRKQFLIDTFKSDIPQQIWDRPKMGFSFPFTEWFKNSDFVNELMQDGQPYTKKNFEKFKAGEFHWSQFMSLIILKNKGLA